MIRLIRWSESSTPRPAPSTPQLLETTVRSPAPCRSSASMSTQGMPLNPKPPTARLAPCGTSATAWAASGTTLSIDVTVEDGGDGSPAPPEPPTTQGGPCQTARHDDPGRPRARGP